jgi:hypothetical protein
MDPRIVRRGGARSDGEHLARAPGSLVDWFVADPWWRSVLSVLEGAPTSAGRFRLDLRVSRRRQDEIRNIGNDIFERIARVGLHRFPIGASAEGSPVLIARG